MYDSTNDTIEHIREVQKLLGEMSEYLRLRSEIHDRSKLQEPEKAAFDKWTPMLICSPYNSPGYKKCLKEIKPAIAHHHKNNRHHPEFFENGILGMNLLDLVELLCDWKAATLRHKDGDLKKSIEIAKEKFNASKEIIAILENSMDLF